MDKEFMPSLQVLLSFWETLNTITQLAFNAKSQSKKETGWSGKGQGVVMRKKESPHRLLFEEKGCWKRYQGEEIDFTNLFRWTLDHSKGVISLEHLRLGPNRPVFLLDLTPFGTHSLRPVDAHLCAEDRYFAEIQFDHKGFHLHWKVIGPQKNEIIDYYYI